MDRILKVAKRLKTFTLEDIVMFCNVDAGIIKDFYKIKQEMGLENYVFNDLRSIENEKLVF